MKPTQMILPNSTTNTSNLYIALELSDTKWKLLFSNGMKRRQKTIPARDLKLFESEMEKATSKLKVAVDAPVYSCYEAGRDGFWIHRYLESKSVRNIVIDPSSIQMNRRRRRAKTDGIDVIKLMDTLLSYLYEAKKVCSISRVPSVEEEDLRRINRGIDRLKKERTSHTNRIKSLLVLHGIKMKVDQHFLKALKQLRQWDGKQLPSNLVRELLFEYDRYELIQKQLKAMEKERKAVLAIDIKESKQIKSLMKLKSIGDVTSWNLVTEFFGWRQFENVKQVGAASGLSPTPYASGNMVQEQGISKAGNPRIRKCMVELSWLWLRHQPQSYLSRWFNQRFAGGGKRMRRIGIVAMSRKLLVALWKYLEKDEVPIGADFKSI